MQENESLLEDLEVVVEDGAVGRVVRTGTTIFYEFTEKEEEGVQDRLVFENVSHVVNVMKHMTCEQLVKVDRAFLKAKELKDRHWMDSYRGKSNTAGYGESDLERRIENVEADVSRVEQRTWKAIAVAVIVSMILVVVISVVSSAAVRLWMV